MINDSVAGMISAAPAPATPRETITIIGLDSTAGTSDAPANMARPANIAPRRP